MGIDENMAASAYPISASSYKKQSNFPAFLPPL
jgi:hypothetical protein